MPSPSDPLLAGQCLSLCHDLVCDPGSTGCARGHRAGTHRGHHFGLEPLIRTE